MPSLTLFLPGRTTQVARLRGDRVTIGRHPDNDLAIPDSFVSNFHARLDALGDGRWQLTDLDSQNGTTVNGIPVREIILEDGDRLYLAMVAGVYTGMEFDETTSIAAELPNRVAPLMPIAERMGEGLVYRSERVRTERLTAPSPGMEPDTAGDPDVLESAFEAWVTKQDSNELEAELQEAVNVWLAPGEEASDHVATSGEPTVAEPVESVHPASAKAPGSLKPGACPNWPPQPLRSAKARRNGEPIEFVE